MMLKLKKIGDSAYAGEVRGGAQVAILKDGRKWTIHFPAKQISGEWQGRYLTWRRTLAEAKERAEWAGFADLGHADDPYITEEQRAAAALVEGGDDFCYDYEDEPGEEASR